MRCMCAVRSVCINCLPTSLVVRAALTPSLHRPQAGQHLAGAQRGLSAASSTRQAASTAAGAQHYSQTYRQLGCTQAVLLQAQQAGRTCLTCRALMQPSKQHVLLFSLQQQALGTPAHGRKGLPCRPQPSSQWTQPRGTATAKGV